MSRTQSNTAPSTPKALADKAKVAKGSQAPSPTQPSPPSGPASALAAALTQAAASPKAKAVKAKAAGFSYKAGPTALMARPKSWRFCMVNTALAHTTTAAADAALCAAVAEAGLTQKSAAAGIHWAWLLSEGYITKD